MDIEAKLIKYQQRCISLEKENKRLHEEIERSQQEKTEYMQNVSHQLVAPLNAIKWHIENLTAGRVDANRAQIILRSIYAQSTIATHLAKNFVLMSNLEADHSLFALQEPLEPVGLYRLMVDLAKNFQPLALDRSVHIEVAEYPLSQAPDVLAMKPLIGQVFSNVIENAMKYSARGSLISIDGRYYPAKETVSVSISNTGIPLPSDGTDQIFQRGYRSKEAQNLHPAGTGFGLFIAKRIIDLHDGSINAQTSHQNKVVFTITLSVLALKGRARQRAAKNSTTHR